MTHPKSKFLWLASIAGIFVFVGDFLITFILGFFYPNYNHLKNVMSELGTLQSPVSIWINLWWIIFGTFFIVFGIGLRKVFLKHSKTSLWGMILIIIFGVSAWIIGGIFPMESCGLETLSSKLHGIFGGIGYLALLFVPIVLLLSFHRKENPRKHWASIIVFVLGVITFILFIASENSASTGGIFSYPGLWQRLFLFVNFAYLGMIAVLMIQISRHPNAGIEV